MTGENEALPGLYRDLRSNLQRYMGGDNMTVMMIANVFRTYSKHFFF